MIHNKLINIIKEEVDGFDFLNNDKRLQSEEITSILKSKDFQKQFICDSLIKRNNNINYKYKDTDISGNWDDIANDINEFSLNYSIDIQYQYDQTKKPINFILSLFGDHIRIDVSERNAKSDYYNEPQQDKWIDNIDWNDINVQLETKDGDDIYFTEFHTAPNNIQIIFLKEYLIEFIEQATQMGIKNDNTDKSGVNTYC